MSRQVDFHMKIKSIQKLWKHVITCFAKCSGVIYIQWFVQAKQWLFSFSNSLLAGNTVLQWHGARACPASLSLPPPHPSLEKRGPLAARSTVALIPKNPFDGKDWMQMQFFSHHKSTVRASSTYTHTCRLTHMTHLSFRVAGSLLHLKKW